MARIGALFYVAWGLLHLYAALQVYKLGSRQAAGMVGGRIYQSAWNLAFFAVAVAVVAVVYNWFNGPLGFWLNLMLTSVTDIGFLLFVIAPGYLPLWPGLLGPALWVAGVLFSTAGFLAARS
jgi:hypothetical protein